MNIRKIITTCEDLARPRRMILYSIFILLIRYGFRPGWSCGGSGENPRPNMKNLKTRHIEWNKQETTRRSRVYDASQVMAGLVSYRNTVSGGRQE